MDTDISTLVAMLPINTILVVCMVAIPFSVVFYAAYKAANREDKTMAEIRTMIGFTSYPHDGSIEYVPVQSRSTYLPTEESK